MINTIANVITTYLIPLTQKYDKSINDLISIENFVDLCRVYNAKEINNQGVQKALEYLIENPKSKTANVLKELNLIQISDDGVLIQFVKLVIEENKTQVEQYKSGKTQVIGYLVGQCMKISKGQGNPQKFNQILKTELETEMSETTKIVELK